VTPEEITEKINNLVVEYDYPLPVLQDVDRRLSDCRDPHYATQQLRYLENNVLAGIAKKKVNK